MNKLALLTLLLVGCASTLTPDERQYRDVENALKWDACQKIYAEHGKPTISKHAHGRTRKHRPHEVREDLILNNCQSILRDWD